MASPSALAPNPPPLLVVPHRYTAWLGAIPPLFGLTSVFVLSMYKDFDSVNKTHCKVANFIPSISSCIGNATPQRYIWRMSISLMIMMRVFSGFIYHNWFQTAGSDQTEGYHRLNKATTGFFMLQYLFLAILTFVGSNENHDIHEASTILFMVTSAVHQWLHIRLYRLSIPGAMVQLQARSYAWKIKACAAFDLGAITMVILYIKHNTVCTPYLYSAFATCEWFCVVVNVIFHYSETLDIGEMSWIFGQYTNRKTL